MADPVTIGAAVGWGISAAGWVVSPIITKLLNKGFSYLGIDGAEKLKQLETKVLQLELLMEVIEQSPCRNQLEKLLQNLRSAFYQAEDILDDVEYYRLEELVLSQSDSNSVASSSRNWVKKLHSALPKSSHPKKGQVSSTTSGVPPPNMSKSELTKILKEIESIVNEAHKILQLLNLPGYQTFDKRQIVAASSRGMVTTAAPPRVVIGRDEHCKEVTDMLRETVGDDQPECSSALRYSRIGIYGIPGSGKSTLAQFVCAHEKNKAHFDVVMWVHLSQNFSVRSILMEMIEQITGKPSPQFHGATTLQNKLEEVLLGKRFLLVLDDVWYSNNANCQDNLRQIVSPLNVGKAGSKILATSRSSDALLTLGAVRRLPIRDLDDDVFLNLFMHYALDYANINARDQQQFEEIGADIAKKLKGSPLAARTVGAQLRKRPILEFWRNARDRDLLNETMGALWWSYQHLDEQVRRCFSYCSIFQRKYPLDPECLVRLWVAEGFVTSHNSGVELEDVGHSYFKELVSASFLQPVDGGKVHYAIHDLLYDLVNKVAGSDCFRADNGWEGEFPEDVRHLSVENCKISMLTSKITKLKNLRTLIISADENDTSLKETAILENMFMGLRRLRVLQITHWRTGMLSFPSSIGQLKHLRYLSVSRHTGFINMILPSTVFRLYHLQLLDCPSILFSSHEDMVKLINLRHLLCLRPLNVPYIGRLVSLQTFQCFRVTKEPGYELLQLKYLNMLGNKLVICGLENVGSKEEALETNLAAKERLTNLTLEWDSDAQQSCRADLQAEILEGLRPQLHLEKLRLCCYNGSRYPGWVVGVRYLCLYRCSRLGGTHGLHELSSLLKLEISECSWDALPDNMEGHRSLETLVIKDCENLRSLPTLPQSLLHFKLSGCDSQFMRSCGMVGHENHGKIQHIFTIIIEWKSPPRVQHPESFQRQAKIRGQKTQLALLGPDKPGRLLPASLCWLVLLLLLFWLYIALGAIHASRLLIVLLLLLFYLPIAIIRLILLLSRHPLGARYSLVGTFLPSRALLVILLLAACLFWYG